MISRPGVVLVVMLAGAVGVSVGCVERPLDYPRGSGGTTGARSSGGASGQDASPEVPVDAGDAGDPTGRACGGFILEAKPCPDGFQCVFPPNAIDRPGTCQKAGGALACFSSVAIDGGAPFQAICPPRCPPGMACVVELGTIALVRDGGGQYCAPIPNACAGTPTCDCMAACVCRNGVGGRPEACTTRDGTINCDNGLR